MGTIFLIIIGVVVLCAIFGFLGSGGKVKGAAAGAAQGAMFSTGCIVQLLLSAIPFVIAIWIYRHIFG